ncbi:hypothetical protein BGZ83_007187 [Gryganskiella cystojenkinii]|nr:hypothetical protein BGZ83_007187 [Gryganskiella cystojenkinii]
MLARLNLCSNRVAALARTLHTSSPSTSTTAAQARFNVAFDIDGVLIKGKQVLPQTRRALDLLQENNVPYILLTNGGGMRESEKADQLSKKLGLKISPDQLIVSHSPMRALAPRYKDSNVMIVGGLGSSCRHVAEDYGFGNVVTPEEVHAVHPSVCPISMCEARAQPLAEKYLRNIERPVDAVMVFHDSVDWGRDLQICLDALVSKGGQLGTIKSHDELRSTKQTVPLYFSNPDVHLTGQDLESITYGKPMISTYQYAESVLDKIAPLPKGYRRVVYAIGDNPYADIAGANGYGWKSVLVRTGVFKPQGQENHAVHPATTVVDHVEDAVQWILAEKQKK